jgi:3-isopropylmalate/(R)-2-methylmalate dehydratase small subunit
MTIQPFETLSATAASLPEDNVDTDIIFPARFLLLMDRDGLGRHLFHDRRFASDGSEIEGFVLNRRQFRDARILVTGANFGCGSSREQAVWALLGFGIRCVIAPGFGEIFHGNCFRNGVLPVMLPEATVAALAIDSAGGKRFDVDLHAKTVVVEGRDTIAFDVTEEQRLALINGWDETALILNAYGARIDAFEQSQRVVQPWLYDEDDVS